LFFNIEV